MMSPLISDWLFRPWLFRPGVFRLRLFRPLSDLVGSSVDLVWWPFDFMSGFTTWPLHLPMWLLVPTGGSGLSLACAIDGMAIEAATMTDATITDLRMVPPEYVSCRPLRPRYLPP